jgi:hypothetical protein
MSGLSERSEPFCDYLSLTTPPDVLPMVLESVDDFFHSFNVNREGDSCYRSASRGTFLWGTRHNVAWLSVSGGFLADLRAIGMLNNFLSSLISHPDAGYMPHRVTRLDLTVDELSYPPDKLDRAYSLGVSGAISLTRKAVTPKSIKKIYSPILYDDSGRDTGTVYFGHRATSKVRLTCYDKTQERYSKGVVIPPTTRYELGVTGDMSISLKDASNPAPCFYNFMPSNLLTRPFVVDWQAHGEGYVLERRECLPSVKLKARMQQSSELKAQLKAASMVGAHGFDYFVTVARQIYEDSFSSVGLRASH